MADLMCLLASILAEEMGESVQLLQRCKQHQTTLLLCCSLSWCLQSHCTVSVGRFPPSPLNASQDILPSNTITSHSHSTECLLVVMLPTLFSSLNSLTFSSTFFSSAHVCWAAGGIPATPFSGSCSPYSERLPREVGAGAEVGVEMEGFNFLTFLGGSSLISEDCSESTLT